MEKLDNKSILITGGTGSFGKEVLNSCLKSNLKEIRIFSRDETKQDELRHKVLDDRVKFIIGDVRDISTLDSALKGVDFVFHAAALKQVPSCEFYPLEAVKTNILGTDNVIKKAIEHNCKKVICLSTDKAVAPVNAMGMSKSLMEKIVASAARDNYSSGTIVSCTRYGNVIASRGSVIPLFLNQINNNKPITITDPSMTRFLMTLEEAVQLVFFAFEHAENGDIFVKKSPAADISTIAEAVKMYSNAEDHPEDILGLRHGEKMHETLLSQEESRNAIDMKDYFRVPSEMHRSAYSLSGQDNSVSEVQEYSSNSSALLDAEGVLNLINRTSHLST